MLILGRTNDDKGAQLEALTLTLLTRLQFTRLTVNEIGAGGEELDLTGERVTGNLGVGDALELLAECKANTAPLGMTQWLKFLGKVFTREAQHRGRNVTARLIALGGVNGNVAGHARALRERRPNVVLVTGDDLLGEVRAAFGVCTPEAARAALGMATTRHVRNMDVCYYDGRAYWAAVLEGDVTALLHANGSLPEAAALDDLRPLLLGALSATDVVDLTAEARARDRTVEAEQLVLCRMMLDGGATRPSGWTEPAVGTSYIGAEPFTPAEVGRAGDALVGRGWARRTGDGQGVEFPTHAGVADREVVIAIDRFLLDGAVGALILRAVWSPWHQGQVTADFVRDLLARQGGVSLSDEDVAEVRQVLAWSPSALRRLLSPIDFLINVTAQLREWEPGESPEREALHRTVAAYVRHHLLELLARDSFHPPFTKPFSERFGVREVERRSRVVVKGDAGPLLDAQFAERLAFGYADMEAFGGSPESRFVALRPLEGAREPWESRSTSALPKPDGANRPSAAEPATKNQLNAGEADP